MQGKDFMKSRASPSLLFVSVLALALSSCLSAYKKSVGGETIQQFNKIYLTDYNTAWQSVLDSLKHSRLDSSNREAGYVQTRWTDNTAEKNFTEAFGTQDAFLKAQYRFSVTVGKAFYNGKPAVKVSVQKEQLIQRDVLEGWKPIESDAIDENTLLYRIGRLILVRMKLTALEEERTKKALESSGF